MRTLERTRGLLSVALLPLHTLVLGALAILLSLLRPRGDAILRLGRWWSRIILATAGVAVRGHHLERRPAGPCVIVSNHQSLFDIPALVVVFGGGFRMVAKRELFRIPVFGWAMWAGGFIPLDRGDRERAIASLRRAGRRIRAGLSVVVFAEGTRSADGSLGPLKKGAFRLAQEASVPVLPVTLSGSRAVLPRKAILPRPGSIDVVVGAPLPPPPAGGPIAESILDDARKRLMAGYTARHRADGDA